MKIKVGDLGFCFGHESLQKSYLHFLSIINPKDYKVPSYFILSEREIVKHSVFRADIIKELLSED